MRFGSHFVASIFRLCRARNSGPIPNDDDDDIVGSSICSSSLKSIAMRMQGNGQFSKKTS